MHQVLIVYHLIIFYTIYLNKWEIEPKTSNARVNDRSHLNNKSFMHLFWTCDSSIVKWVLLKNQTIAIQTINLHQLNVSFNL